LARNHQRSPALLIRLRDVGACLEERAHAREMAMQARTRQWRLAVWTSLRGVRASLEERAHALELALLARMDQRSPAIRSSRLRDVCASLEERAHALELALLARVDQGSHHAVWTSLRDVCARCEQGAHELGLAGVDLGEEVCAGHHVCGLHRELDPLGLVQFKILKSLWGYSTRRPRTAIIGTSHSGREPLKKNWSYYKRTGSAWEDLDHVPPARLKHFVRPDLGLKAAQAIGRRYEQEQVLADMRSWALTVNRAKLREAHALKRETRERMEAYCGVRSVRTGAALSSSASAELAQSGSARGRAAPRRAAQRRARSARAHSLAELPAAGATRLATAPRAQDARPARVAHADRAAAERPAARAHALGGAPARPGVCAAAGLGGADLPVPRLYARRALRPDRPLQPEAAGRGDAAVAAVRVGVARADGDAVEQALRALGVGRDALGRARASGAAAARY
jgi:hypothetical protein